MRPEIANRCDLFYEVLSDFLDGELAEMDCAYVEEHLRLCPPCDTYLEQFRIVVASTEKLEQNSVPPAIEGVQQNALREWKQQD